MIFARWTRSSNGDSARFVIGMKLRRWKLDTTLYRAEKPSTHSWQGILGEEENHKIPFLIKAYHIPDILRSCWREWLSFEALLHGWPCWPSTFLLYPSHKAWFCSLNKPPTMWILIYNLRHLRHPRVPKHRYSSSSHVCQRQTIVSVEKPPRNRFELCGDVWRRPRNRSPEVVENITNPYKSHI